MPTRRVKIEFFDGSGTRHVVVLEGNISRDKVVRVLDYVELMGGLASLPHKIQRLGGRTKMERITDLIVSRFRDKIFTSSDLQQVYAETYGEEITMSTVATYLSRLVDKGVLRRTGSSNEWRYALVSEDILALNP